MPLDGNIFDTILELDDKDVSHEGGITAIVNNLNKLYTKDELNEKFEDLKHLECYRRSTKTQQFVVEFDQVYIKLKRHGTV